MSPNRETVLFGAGCFWCVEARFLDVPGVIEVTSGYSGGSLDEPSYKQVCTGTTGHAEVVEVVYDPGKVAFEDLLDAFFDVHDPTQLNRQGPDIGTQYRSAIFTTTEQQHLLAQKAIKDLNASGRFRDPVVTQLAPASTFWRAEDYHQRYYDKMGLHKPRLFR